jgi:signal transduction histidine kinase
MGIEGPFWRAIGVFRVASLVYAVALLVRADGYQEPALGWLVMGVMALWTLVTIRAYSEPRLRGWPLLAADMLVAVACLLATPYVQGVYQPGALPITATWMGGPVLAWGVYGGRWAGAAGAAIIAAIDLWLHGLRDLTQFGAASLSINGMVLLFLAGVLIAHVAHLAKQAEERVQRAVEIEAAGRERERLARGIHDSVLQVLALVQRRGVEIGGEAAELGRLAGEQEAALRALVGVRREPPAAGVLDLCTLLRGYGGAEVTVSTPATPVHLPADTARETALAVAAALDNVRRHCGPDARAWILLEQERDSVTVSVRDDGPGVPEGRLAEAAAAGRLGVAQSIKGRVADLGGTVSIVSAPGQGTEVELTVPS